jgi:hypothetical protein
LSLCSIQINEAVIKHTTIHAFRTGAPYAPNAHVLGVIQRQDFWNNLSSLLQVLRPMKTMFDLFSTSDVSLADCYAGYVSLNSILLSLCSSSNTMNQRKLTNKLFAQMTPSINENWSIFNKTNEGIYLLAYFCHPRYHKRGLLRHHFQNILRTALTIWMKRRKNEIQARTLRQGLHDFWTGEGPYNVQTFWSSGVEPRSWISVLPNAELVELGLLLLEMQPIAAGFAKYNSWETIVAPLDHKCKLSDDYANACLRLKSIYEAREGLMHPVLQATVADVIACVDNVLAQCEAASQDPGSFLDEVTLMAHLSSLAKDWSMSPTDEYDPSANLNLLASLTFELGNADLHQIWKSSSLAVDTSLISSIPVSSSQDQGFNIDELVNEYV